MATDIPVDGKGLERNSVGQCHLLTVAEIAWRSNPGPLPAGMPKSTVMMSPARMALQRSESDGDDGPLVDGRLMHRQLGTHPPLAFRPRDRPSQDDVVDPTTSVGLEGRRDR